MRKVILYRGHAIIRIFSRGMLAMVLPVAVACTTGNDKETHLQNLKQLTFGGDNAEAYFSYDGRSLVFQSNNGDWGLECDQIFSMEIREAMGDCTYMP